MWFVLGCAMAPSITESQLEHARTRVAESSAGRDAVVTARQQAMAHATTVAPGDAPCPIEVPVPSNQVGSTSSLDEAMAMLRSAKFMAEGLEQVTSPAQLGTSVGPAVLARDRLREAVEEILAAPGTSGAEDPGAELAEKADALAAPLGWDVSLVAHLSTAPIAVGDGFQAGAMVGRVLVYSYPEARIVCVADAVANSSGQVSVVRTEIGGAPISSSPMTDQTALHQDLVVNLLRAAIPALRAVAPAP